VHPVIARFGPVAILTHDVFVAVGIGVAALVLLPSWPGSWGRSRWSASRCWASSATCATPRLVLAYLGVLALDGVAGVGWQVYGWLP
jgi:hypothetical protein